MQKAILTGAVVFVVVAAGMFFGLGQAFEADAAAALRLRAGGETVHTQVISRTNRTETHGTGSSRRTEHIIEVVVSGALADGRVFENALAVTQEEFDQTPVGSEIDVVVNPTDLGEFRRASDLARADASGHTAGEGTFRLVAGLGGGAFVGFLAFLITKRRRRT